MGSIIDLIGYRYAKSVGAHKLPKKTTTLEWVSIEQRLPEPSRRWFAVVLEHVGGMKTISGSQFISGEWAHCRDVFSRVTHWAELPKELP
jgi:hypothetical protein